MVISSTHQCRAPEKTPLRLRPNLPQALATDTLKPTMTGQIILGWIVPSEWLARCELRHNSSRSLRFNLAALNWMVTRTPLLTAFRRLHAHPYQIEYARSEAGERSGDTQLFVKEVNVDGRRYIVCRNKAEAEKDRIEREQIVAALDAQLKRSATQPTAAICAKTTDRPAFAIDGGKRAEEARFDGVFVLRTNARVSPLQAVLRYRDLLQVEDLFRRAKPDLPLLRCRHSRPRVLFVPCPADAETSRRSRPKGRHCCAMGRTPARSRPPPTSPSSGVPLQGAMNGKTFKAYVEQFLAPTLRRGDIVFMDNVSVHKVDGIEEAIEARGAILFYLPAYSPDLNPIEQLFSKLKAIAAQDRCAFAQKRRLHHRQSVQGNRLLSWRDLPVGMCRIPRQFRIWSTKSGNALGACLGNSGFCWREEGESDSRLA